MNSVHLSGRIASDPEIREFDDRTLCRFSLAVSAGPDRADFFSVEYWNPNGVVDLLEKGAPVLVSGFLKQDQWTADNGEKRSRVVVSARLLELLETRAAAEVRRRGASAEPDGGHAQRGQRPPAGKGSWQKGRAATRSPARGRG
ncbi:MAG: single-stranded DNA-binding protein [Opitutales bacterium]|nr:single-stranded DNA-binding protein [Opitutales bacterium]